MTWLTGCLICSSAAIVRCARGVSGLVAVTMGRPNSCLKHLALSEKSSLLHFSHEKPACQYPEQARRCGNACRRRCIYLSASTSSLFLPVLLFPYKIFYDVPSKFLSGVRSPPFCLACLELEKQHRILQGTMECVNPHIFLRLETSGQLRARSLQHVRKEFNAGQPHRSTHLVVPAQMRVVTFGRFDPRKFALQDHGQSTVFRRSPPHFGNPMGRGSQRNPIQRILADARLMWTSTAKRFSSIGRARF